MLNDQRQAFLYGVEGDDKHIQSALFSFHLAR